MSKYLGELLLRSLETELGAVRVYAAAVQCAVNDDLRKEWEACLEQATLRTEIVRGVLVKLGLDPEAKTLDRQAVYEIAELLVKAMRMAKENGTADEAQLVACECVVIVEPRGRANWEFVVLQANGATGEEAKVLKRAVEQMRDQEDQQLFHTKGWCRELGFEFFGTPPALAPDEDDKDARSGLGLAPWPESAGGE